MKFPSTPINGQIFKPYLGSTYSYQWNGQGWDVVRSVTVNDDPVQEDGSSSGFIKKIVEDVGTEIPVGEIDGVNCIFKLESAPLLGSEYVYLNGVMQRRGIDYEITNEYFTLIEPPFAGESLLCRYSKVTLKEVLNEVPSGEMNGRNNIFVLKNIPIDKSELIYLNGILLIKGDALDYTISNNILYLNEYPSEGELLICTYKTKV
jgi:hypothetical protein